MTREILCTIGPASMNGKILARFERLGVHLLRINLSHTRLEDLANVIRRIRAHTRLPISLDSEGAQIRTGMIRDGKASLKENSLVRLQRTLTPGEASCFNLYPREIIKVLEIGDLLSIDFNSVLAQVIERKEDAVSSAFSPAAWWDGTRPSP